MDQELDLKNIKGLNRFTENAKQAILDGYKFAKDFSFPEYKSIHLFYVFLVEKKGMVMDVLTRVGVDIENSIKRIQESFNKNKAQYEDPIVILPSFSDEIKKLINESFVISSQLGHVYVGSEHLLLSMFTLQGIDFIEEMKKVGINFDVMKKVLLSIGNYPAVSATLESGDKDFQAS